MTCLTIYRGWFLSFYKVVIKYQGNFYVFFFQGETVHLREGEYDVRYILQDGAPKIVLSCLNKVAEFYGFLSIKLQFMGILMLYKLLMNQQ